MNWWPFKTKAVGTKGKACSSPLPLEVIPHEVEWTDSDAAILKNFLGSPTGQKYEQIQIKRELDAALRACGPIPMNSSTSRDFQAGETTGIQSNRLAWLTLCKTRADFEKEAAARTDGEPTEQEVQDALNALARGDTRDIDLGE